MVGDISAFDLDHTLLNCNSSFSFAIFLYRQGRFSLFLIALVVFFYLAHKCKILSVHNLHKVSFYFFFKGANREEIVRYVELYLEGSFSTLLFHPALKLLREAKQGGSHIAIFSSSPDFIVEAFAHRLQVDSWKGSSYLIDHLGIFTHIGVLIDGEKKARALQELTQLFPIKGSTTAYSDSYLDLPFLMAADNAVAVMPDRRLLKVSRTLGWQIVR